MFCQSLIRNRFSGSVDVKKAILQKRKQGEKSKVCQITQKLEGK